MDNILRITQNLSRGICVKRFVSYANSLHASDMRPIGEVIRALRKAKGMTLEELADKAGTDSGNMSRLERGKQGYTQERLEAIAKGLELTVADLWLEALDAEQVTPKERVFLKKLRSLSEDAQDAWQKLIDPPPTGKHQGQINQDSKSKRA